MRARTMDGQETGLPQSILNRLIKGLQAATPYPERP